MLSEKAAAPARRRIGRLRLRPAAASGRLGGGIGRLRLRQATSLIVPGGRGRRQRGAAAGPVLPDDALVEILSRVPARSLCRFKCVSRAWRDLIAGRLGCTKLPQTLAGFFVYHDGEDIHGDDGRVVGRFVNTSGRSVPLASFSFLGKQPGLQEFGLLCSCNGLLLFGHRRASHTYDSLGYIVCNPATEQWVTVPRSGWRPDWYYGSEGFDSDTEPHPDTEDGYSFTYLIFDPAVSSHFQLVQFGVEADDNGLVKEMHTYSSQTGLWCETNDFGLDEDGDTFEWSSDEWINFYAGSAVVNGLLHLSVTRGQEPIIVAVDGEGKKRRIVRGPEKHAHVAFVGDSQGRLHYMTDHRENTRGVAELSIWVLQDYNAEEWVLKHTVTSLQLFGRMSCRAPFDYEVVAIHADCNLIFFLQDWDLKLKSYNMDSKEVCTVHNIWVPHQIFPYVPYYAESSALANKR